MDANWSHEESGIDSAPRLTPEPLAPVDGRQVVYVEVVRREPSTGQFVADFAACLLLCGVAVTLWELLD